MWESAVMQGAAAAPAVEVPEISDAKRYCAYTCGLAAYQHPIKFSIVFKGTEFCLTGLLA
jgi:hypothetical protein